MPREGGAACPAMGCVFRSAGGLRACRHDSCPSRAWLTLREGQSDTLSGHWAGRVGDLGACVKGEASLPHVCRWPRA